MGNERTPTEGGPSEKSEKILCSGRITSNNSNSSIYLLYIYYLFIYSFTFRLVEQHDIHMQGQHKNSTRNFMVTPCINNAEPFYYQLMHIMLKNTELLKHSKINKNASTCFGLHRNHLQGAKVSAWLKITHLVNSICVKDVQGFVSAMAAYCDL